MKTKVNLIRTWLKNPASWIATLSLFVSLATYYTVHLREGDIVIDLPDRIGVIPSQGGAVSLLVPTIFHYTGAPDKQKIVKEIIATVVVIPDVGPVNQPSKYSWMYLYRFVGKDEYEHKYPEKPKNDNLRDYVEYDGRSWSFGLSGGNVVQKVLGLEPASATPSITTPAVIELSLEVSTEERKQFYQKARYRLSKEDFEIATKTNIYDWIPQVK